MAVNIQILPSARINKEKWDALVSSAENGLIYAYSEYLDHVCDNWSGIIADDYKAIMPLPWRRKFGIRYIYQPAFIQQLGLIGSDAMSFTEISAFARYGDILLNFHNEQLANEWNALSKSNFVIDLSNGYDTIHAGYKKDLLLNLKKADKEDLAIRPEPDIEFAVKMYKLLYQQRMDDLHDKDFGNFTRLAKRLAAKGMCFARKIENDMKATLAIGLFLRDNKRIYNLMNTTTDEGRIKEANHFLLDGVIKEFAGQPLLFDFEGSDIPGVKNFYGKFGGMDQHYFHFHYNHLPAIVKLLKK